MKRERQYTRLARDDWYLDVATVADVNCITSDWAASESIEATPRGVSDEIQKAGIRDRIARLIRDKKGACIRPSDKFLARRGLQRFPDGSPLFAWAVYGWDLSTQMPSVYFVYTKGQYRHNGLAKALVQEAAAVEEGTVAWCTSSRRWLEPSLEKYGLIYNPYILERK